MKSKRRTAALVAAWTTVGVLGAAALTGVAMAADSGTPQAQPTATASASPAGGGDHAGLRRLKALGQRVLHGEFVVAGRQSGDSTTGARTLDTQLGVITSISPTAVDVRSSDGYTQTWNLTPTTRVRVNGGRGTTIDLKVGGTVRLIGPKDGSTASAALVVLRESGPPAS